MRRIVGALSLLVAMIAIPAASAKVLLVGSYHGKHGKYRSIQAAIDAARPGDWVLVGPGDYKEHSDKSPGGVPGAPAGILITKDRLHLRGMNRNTVVVDGTSLGSPKCSSAASDQLFGPAGLKSGDGPLGVNGIMVWKARDTSVENLTACNYLHGSGDTGNEIWWNGGDGSSKVGGWGFTGSWLTTTSTFYKDEHTAAQYGIFSSNWSGGTWDHDYASNFNDSGFYIGACQQVCDQTMNHSQAEFNALGYSGSNSGGPLLVENSEFDNNEDGFDTNSQNGDNPPPQDGSCPAGVQPPLAGAPTCWVFANNYVHDNNNDHAPALGSAAQGPVGTGMSVSGGRNDTIMNNRFVNNNAWGFILVPYLDSGPPCTGGTLDAIGPGSCLFDEWGDHIVGNTFTHNGGYGHPTNGDIAWFNFQSGHPTPCFSGNTDTSGTVTTSPAGLQQTNGSCNGSAAPANGNTSFLLEVLCDSGVELVSGVPPTCPTGSYPARGAAIMHPLPKHLATMPNPCAGVPANAWCPARRRRRRHG